MVLSQQPTGWLPHWKRPLGDGGDALAVKQKADNIKQMNQLVIVANEEVASVS